MRNKKDHRRDICSDAKYQSKELARFINNLMLAGNKATVEKFVYRAIQQVSDLTGMKDIPLLFEKILRKSFR